MGGWDVSGGLGREWGDWDVSGGDWDVSGGTGT